LHDDGVLQDVGMIACVEGVAVTKHDEVRLERGRAGRLAFLGGPIRVRQCGGAAL